MAEGRKVKRRGKGGLTKTALIERVRQWAVLDKEAKQVEARKKELRDGLLSWIETYGEEDEKGNGFLELPEPVEGIAGLKRERRVSQRLDWDPIIALAKERGIKVTKKVEVPDEDALYAAVYSGKITEQELDKFTVRSENFAFKPVNAR